VIVDTSALIAILVGEAERDTMIGLILEAPSARMSAANYLEAAVVVDRRGDPVLSRRLDELIDALGIEVVDLTMAQAILGRAAYRDFGKGTGHRAQLNLGDCFAYALASEAREPLLFKGDDFTPTDVRPAMT
jgi:ribonuclease VapC